MVQSAQNPENGENILKRQYSNLRIINDILHRHVTSDDQEKQHIVSPSTHITTVLQAMYNDIGNSGKDITLKNRFSWPDVGKDVEECISRCGRSIRRKAPRTIEHR